VNTLQEYEKIVKSTETLWKKPFKYNTNIAENLILMISLKKVNLKMQNCGNYYLLQTRNQIGCLNEIEECNSKTKNEMVI